MKETGNEVVNVEVVPGVEAEITDIEAAEAAAMQEVKKAEIEAVPEHTEEDEEVMVPMGTASLADIVTGNVPAPTDEEVAQAIEDNSKPVQVRAKEKLEAELKNAKDKSFAEPIIEYLIKRCEEDTGLAEDVCQPHKKWDKCFDYIYEQARKLAKNNRQCAVRNDVVFEWAEDYYHKDDKAEEEKKAKEVAEKKKKAAEVKKTAPVKKENKARLDYDTTRKSPADNRKLSKSEIAEMDAKKAEKPKKNNKNDMDGQMDLFSMMGL